MRYDARLFEIFQCALDQTKFACVRRSLLNALFFASGSKMVMDWGALTAGLISLETKYGDHWPD